VKSAKIQKNVIPLHFEIVHVMLLKNIYVIDGSQNFLVILQ